MGEQSQRRIVRQDYHPSLLEKSPEATEAGHAKENRFSESSPASAGTLATSERPKRRDHARRDAEKRRAYPVGASRRVRRASRLKPGRAHSSGSLSRIWELTTRAFLAVSTIRHDSYIPDNVDLGEMHE